MRIAAILTAVVMIISAPAVPAAEPALTPAQRQAVEEIVRDFIRNNPDFVIQAVQDMRAKREAEERERGTRAVVARADELFRDPGSPVGGNPNGNVTVVEFFDYQCGYCKQVFPALQSLLKDDPNVRFVYKEFPILGPDSVLAARSALAAWRLDARRYHGLHVALMEARGPLTEERVMRIVADAGYDPAKVRKGVADPVIDAMLQKNFKLAEELNITGTPGFVIGNQVVPGAIDLAAMKRLVGAARQR